METEIHILYNFYMSQHIKLFNHLKMKNTLSLCVGCLKNRRWVGFGLWAMVC